MKSPELSAASRSAIDPGADALGGPAAVTPGRARWLLPFVLGLNTQIAQLLILREAMILSSGSETALGLCLGAWALVNGLGALAGWTASRGGLNVGRLFVPLLTMLPLLMAGSIHLARLSRSLVDVPVAEHLPVTTFFVLALLVVGPVTLVDGFLFVSGVRFLFDGRCGARGAAFMYGVESLGSLAGGVFFSFFLVFVFDPMSIAGLLICVNGLGIFRAGGGGTRRPRVLVLKAVFVVAGAATVFFGPEVNTLSEQARWRVLQPHMELSATRDSRYQNLAVLSYDGEPTLFANGSVLFALRSPSDGGRSDWNRAVFPHFAMLQHAAPRRVLLVGGVSKGYATDILLHEPERVDLVEFDGELLDLTEPYLSDEETLTFDDDRIETHVIDGRHFVITAPAASYDLILLDLPDPSNASTNRYYTEEFFASCRRALRPEGALVFSLSNQPNLIGKEMMERNGSVFEALNRVFDEFLITPGELSFVAAATTPGSLSASADELLRRYESRNIDTPRFSAYIFFTWFDENDVDWVNRVYRQELEKGRIRPNTDNRPVAYVKDYLLWRRITGSGRSSDRSSGRPGVVEGWLSGTGESVPILAFLPALFPMAGVFFLAIFLVGGRSRPIRIGAPRALHFTTAAAIGFNGIVLEVAILLFYQGVAGHLYSRMGIIIASYMAGLVAGSLFPGERRFPGALFVFSCICTFAGVGGVFALMSLSTKGALLWGGQSAALLGFGLVTALLGASGGLAFRGAAMALESGGRSPGGLIYTLDILGTCLGGVLAGSVLVPFVGISGVALLAGGMNVILPMLSFSVIFVNKNEN